MCSGGCRAAKVKEVLFWIDFTYDIKHFTLSMLHVFIPLRQARHVHYSSRVLWCHKAPCFRVRKWVKTQFFLKLQMQKIHTKHLFLKLCSFVFEAVISGSLLNEAAAEQRTVLSLVGLRFVLVYRVVHRPRACWTHARSCGAFDALHQSVCAENKCVKNGLQNSCLNYRIISPPLLYPLYFSVFCTNNAELHRCIIYFIISGATTWTDDQIRLIAFVCMFLLESRLWKENKLFHPTQ